MTTQPNLLVVLTDQLPAGILGCYGGGVDSMPALTRLARRGAQFNRAYCSVALCAPNRACLLTGRSPEAHGVTHNDLALHPSTPTFAHVLRDHGYATGGFGKFHQTPMMIMERPFPVPVNLDHLGFDACAVTEDPRLGPWLEWVRENHPHHYLAALSTCWETPAMACYEIPEADLAAARRLRETRGGDFPWPLVYPSPFPPEVHQSTWIAERSIDFIEHHRATHPEQPFLCVTSFVAPHDPYDPPEPYYSMFDPAEVPDPIPATWPENGSPTLEMNWNFGPAPGFGSIARDPVALRKLRAVYHGSLKLIDDQIAQLVTCLEKQGVADNTVIVFTSDHGDMLGDHALITKGTKHFDKGIRVPLIISGAGILPGERTALTCALDLFPTLCDLAGVRAWPPLEGVSLAPSCTGREGVERWRAAWSEVTVQICGNHQCPRTAENVRSVITDDGWRLTYLELDDRWQMYDLANDPEEQANLFYRKEHADKRLELLTRFTYAYMQSVKCEQFRNQPVYRGRRYPVHPVTPAAETYQGLDLPGTFALDGCLERRP